MLKQQHGLGYFSTERKSSLFHVKASFDPPIDIVTKYKKQKNKRRK